MKKILLTIIFAGVLVATCFFLQFAPVQAVNGSPADMEEYEGEERLFFTSPPLPDILVFAGEEVPLGRVDVYESLDRELLVNSYFHSQTLRFLKLAPRFFSIIEPILQANSIPLDFKYLALAESSFNPVAISPAGAAGLWQFMRDTAIEYGLEVNREVDERYHIQRATAAACRYLKDSYDKYGNWALVAASYNAGRRGVENQMKRQQSDDYYDMLWNEETGRYMFRILALKLILENPEKYGFKVKEHEKYPLWETININVNTPVHDFAVFAKENGTSYKILKMLNPWLRDTSLANTKGKTYSILLPGKDFREVKTLEK